MVVKRFSLYLQLKLFPMNNAYLQDLYSHVIPSSSVVIYFKVNYSCYVTQKNLNLF